MTSLCDVLQHFGHLSSHTHAICKRKSRSGEVFKVSTIIVFNEIRMGNVTLLLYTSYVQNLYKNIYAMYISNLIKTVLNKTTLCSTVMNKYKYSRDIKIRETQVF